MTFDVQIKGLKEMQSAFAKAPEIAEPIYQEAINKSAAILDHNRTNPFNIPWITGELARRWTTVFNRLTLKTKPNVEYARAVQFGMPPSPGRYVPAIKKRLKNGPNIGTWPGFKGRHFMEKIVRASVEDINIVFRNAMKAITGEIAKGK